MYFLDVGLIFSGPGPDRRVASVSELNDTAERAEGAAGSRAKSGLYLCVFSNRFPPSSGPRQM